MTEPCGMCYASVVPSPMDRFTGTVIYNRLRSMVKRGDSLDGSLH